jgi:hypothetical protein
MALTMPPDAGKTQQPDGEHANGKRTDNAP